MLMKYLPRQISVSSCAMTGDRIWRKLSHKRYIWTVCHQCVYGSGGSAHLISQTARCSLPMYIHTASPLVRKLIILGYRSLNVWVFMQKNKVDSVAVLRYVYLCVSVGGLSGANSLCRLYCSLQSHTCGPAFSFLGLWKHHKLLPFEMVDCPV